VGCVMNGLFARLPGKYHLQRVGWLSCREGGILLPCEKASSWLENIVLASTLSDKRRPQKRLKFSGQAF
jgi:hypothetical protein